MWTQPAKTLGVVYLRVRTSTPGGPCTDNAGSVIGHFSLNGDEVMAFSPTVQIGVTYYPLTGSYSPMTPLFPGTYQFDTVIETSNLSSLCYGTIFRTQMAVQTTGG